MDFEDLIKINVGDILDIIGNPGLAGLYGKILIIDKAPKNQVSKLVTNYKIGNYDNMATWGDIIYVGKRIESSPVGEFEEGELILFDFPTINLDKTKIHRK